ncbi:MAG: hypothetical protein AMQ22_00067 [Candidatus Methanofastidiosum methylothiophilum]|uniref:DUF5518 domain-containing protein n=1 Tax=Candidatus Methanofastidiosum methylothiophilum TaxID=1705564 RepID=A0A150J9W2_9EURY|nr:MAG: hypothetical protein AMQ22_00067 [Candidatus Methanofastidiosum methylthiophilus]
MVKITELISIKGLIIAIPLAFIGTILASTFFPNFYIEFLLGLGFGAFFIGLINYTDTPKTLRTGVLLGFLYSLLSIGNLVDFIIFLVGFILMGIIGGYIGVWVRRTYISIWRTDKTKV